MSALHLSHQHKATREAVKNPQQCEPPAHDDLLASFPLPRYFQVHFQYIHERNDAVHQELAELKIHVHQQESKLDNLLMLLEQQQCDC